MKRIALGFFLLFSVAELLSQVFAVNFLHHLSKPFIMLMLGWYYISSVEKNGRSRSVLLAIIFSFLGDTLLLYEYRDTLYFIAGLISFLLAHIFYIITYRQHRWEEFANQLMGVQRVRLAFPVVLAGSGLVVILYPTLGALKFPVMLYALILVVMVLGALFRFGRTSTKSFWFVFSGAVLFMVSDSWLAINKFLTPLKAAGVWIMITYLLAQFLIIEGLIKHVEAMEESQNKIVQD